MKRARLIGLVAGACLIGAAIWNQTRPKPAPTPPSEAARQVTALGRLTPKNGITKLSVPAGVTGGNEIVTEWVVEEGSEIQKGQLLAKLSSYDQLKASVSEAQQRLNLSQDLLPYWQISEQKAKAALKKGVISEEEYVSTKTQLASKASNVATDKTALVKAKSDLSSALVTSPVQGRLIKIYSWPGMKETSDGLGLVGNTGEMQVWSQVFQTDISKIRVGQRAKVRAESGGFKGTLGATVNAIVGQVSERDIFAVDGSNDVNARVILVKLDLDPADRAKTMNLSGLNVLVSFSSDQ